jgi:hypothetical protein
MSLKQKLQDEIKVRRHLGEGGLLRLFLIPLLEAKQHPESPMK